MNQIVSTLVAIAVVVGMVGSVPAMGMAPPSHAPTDEPVTVHAQQSPTDVADENASAVSPGERLSAVIGVQDAELEGEIENRAFGIAVARAVSDGERASVVAEQFDRIQQRLNDLEERRAALEKARENGEIGEGQYQAQVTVLTAQARSSVQLADASGEEAETLPAELLEERGVNASQITTLKNHADEMTGPEVAAIATSIAGEVGAPMGQAGPGQRGPPGAPGSQGGNDGETDENATVAIERADAKVVAARQQLHDVRDRVNETNASDDALEALDAAAAELANAEAAVGDARAALEAGDRDEALALAMDALGYAEEAQANAQDALAAAIQQGQDGDGQPDGDGAGADGTNADEGAGAY